MNDLQKLSEICAVISRENDLQKLMKQILDAALDIAQCRAGTLYLRENDSLVFKISRNIDLPAYNGENVDLPPIPLSSRSHLCTLAAAQNRTIHIPDAYDCQEYDLSGPMQYDSITGFQTVSVLVCPIATRSGENVAVLQLINAVDAEGKVRDFSEKQQLIEILSSQLAIVLQDVKYQSELESMKKSLAALPESAAIPAELRHGLQSFLASNYYGAFTETELNRAIKESAEDKAAEDRVQAMQEKSMRFRHDREQKLLPPSRQSIEGYIKDRRSSFGYEILARHIWNSDLKQAEIARRAHIDPAILSGVISGSRVLKKSVIIPLAIVLHLTLDQTEEIMTACGESFKGSDVRDLILQYCIQYNEDAAKPLDLGKINDILYDWDPKAPLKLLGN